MKPSSNALWEKLAKVEDAAGVCQHITKLEDGWFTAREYAYQRGVSSRTARERLGKMRDAGKLDSKLVSIKVEANEHPKVTRIYRIKD